MKTALQRRLALFAGLLLLSLLVLAIGLQAAQAYVVAGGGGGGTLQVTSGAAGTQGRGGTGPLAPASAAQPASASGTSSTTFWVVVGVVLSVAIISVAAWILVRRRRRPVEVGSASYCALHPEDSLCGAA